MRLGVVCSANMPVATGTTKFNRLVLVPPLLSLFVYFIHALLFPPLFDAPMAWHGMAWQATTQAKVSNANK